MDTTTATNTLANWVYKLCDRLEELGGVHDHTLTKYARKSADECIANVESEASHE